ncbi:MAG: 1-acyl-sn-glycerol-3-phosphate acyltransferase [Polyangiaceae bacterium]
MLRRCFVWLFRRIIGVYFSDIEAVGAVPEASSRARLFVSNHVNALVDPILVLTAAPCPISPVAKSTLWKIPVLRWLLDLADAVPLVRRRDAPDKPEGQNDAVFDRVADWLSGGGNILIFPEGTSHNEPRLLALKTGAARMLVRAHARSLARVSFQAVALEFDARHVFRSRVLLVYGPVRFVDQIAAADDAGRVQAITEQVRADLSELLVEGSTWGERVLIARVAEMLAHDAGDRTMAAWSDVGRQVEAARATLRTVDEASVARVAAAVERYYALLDEEGLGDAEIAEGGGLRRAELPGRLLLLGAALPFAALATVLYWLPYQVPRLAALKVAEDPDEISTYKLAAGLIVYPIWLAGLTTAAFLLAPPLTAALATAVFVLAPLVALGWRDLSRPLRRAFRKATRARRLDQLRAARAEVMEVVRVLRERHGL